MLRMPGGSVAILRRIARAELRARHNVGAPQRAQVARYPEDLAAVARPPAALRRRDPTPARSDRPWGIPAPTVAGCHCRPTRTQPLAIRRDGAAKVPAHSLDDHRFGLSRLAASRSTMSCAVPVSNVLKTIVEPSGRPVDGILEHQIRGVELRFRLGAVELLDEELLAAGSVGGEHDAAAIGRPDRRIVATTSGREWHDRSARSRSTSQTLDSDGETERTTAALVPSGEIRAES